MPKYLPCRRISQNLEEWTRDDAEEAQRVDVVRRKASPSAEAPTHRAPPGTRTRGRADNGVINIVNEIVGYRQADVYSVTGKNTWIIGIRSNMNLQTG